MADIRYIMYLIYCRYDYIRRLFKIRSIFNRKKDFGILNTLVFVNIGAVGVFFSLKALIITLYIPLFTSLFSFIPVNNMINKIDPISMIEKV